MPAIARSLGMRVVLGEWIDGDAARNAAQPQRALALAGDYADVTDLLVIGNEVLLRGEQTPAALASLLARAKRTSSVPIAYADVRPFSRGALCASVQPSIRWPQ
ncbi:MAG: hypothetical protein V5B39_17575 [Accumulibacter sp.]|uniref:hypothetical protein n=1 Tax=Accumulibacter sp. TaxID=2053492 RepID=UPI002FC2FBE0